MYTIQIVLSYYKLHITDDAYYTRGSTYSARDAWLNAHHPIVDRTAWRVTRTGVRGSASFSWQ